jgi:hypothetical protein
MTTKTKTKRQGGEQLDAARRSPLAELERLRGELAEAGNQVDSIDLERRKAGRSRHRAQGALIAYHTEVAAGDRKADAGEERELRAELQKVRAATALDFSMSGGPVVVDLALEGQAAGLRQIVSLRKSAVALFIVDHRAELVLELTPVAEQARDRLLEERSEPARAHWAAVRNLWVPLIERWGISPRELPSVPSDFGAALAPFASGQPRDPRDLWPMPQSLVPGADPQSVSEEPGVARERTLEGA